MPAQADPDPLFPLRRVRTLGHDSVPIVLQNENGPCPLLALANALLLRGDAVLPLSLHPVSAPQSVLLSLVRDRIVTLGAAAALRCPEQAADAEQSVRDATSKLAKLATGIDVNPRFDAADAFEFTDEIALFDLCGENRECMFACGCD